jgi:DNA-binding NarL/FixJ family response regulator
MSRRTSRSEPRKLPTPQFSRDRPTTGLDYWQSRLTHRKYVNDVRLTPVRELSVRLEHLGTAFYFPLGSEDPVLAASRADQIQRALIKDGWESVRKRFSREIALAVLWNSNPFACTYTTLLTELEPEPGKSNRGPTSADAEGLVRVCIAEREEGVRRALANCIERNTGFRCVRAVAEIPEALPYLGEIDFLLFNHRLPEVAEDEFRRRLEAAHPGVVSFPFGIYEDSDPIFASVTGVSGGYLLRRRVPMQLLDPISGPWRDRSWTPAAVRAQVEQYFRSLFSLRWPSDAPSGGAKLTPREIEILHCLRQGFPDKVIAQALNLSVWTVHTHLKKIFEKLGAHTRTEAVARYSQK